jgi:glycosyltransferase involved in cell wall biosynthesis
MKPKVLIIENNLISSLTMRDRLTRELMKDYEVTILSTGNDGQKKAAAARGFRIVEVGASNQNPLGIVKYLLKLRREILRNRPDVVLTFTIRPAIWGNLITRFLGIPTITSITGIGPLFSQKAVAYRAARLLYRFALKRTKKVFFQNTEDMGLFISHGFADASRSECIPGSGVDPEHFAPVVPKTNGTFTFLFIGRLVKDKGISEFVQASEILKGRSLSVKCNVLGPYWTQNLKDNNVTPEEMNSWVSRGSIQYLGEAIDVRPFMAAADCIVLPSYREGLNNVLLEASSMERPCISTDTTGCREVIEHGITGFLCNVKDANDLADKMEQMFREDPQNRSAMGRKARQKVIREFNKNIVVAAYMSAIKDILQDS